MSIRRNYDIGSDTDSDLDMTEDASAESQEFSEETPAPDQIDEDISICTSDYYQTDSVEDIDNIELDIEEDIIGDELIDASESIECEPIEEDTCCSENDSYELPSSSDLDLQEVSEWIGEINPNYDPFDLDSAYDNNCGSCAFSVFQRLEGNDLTTAGEENISNIEQMNEQTGMEQVSMSPGEIERVLLEQGSGAHAIIGIDRVEGPGHWFNAANIDGKIMAIDGQTGEINDWPPDYGDVKKWDMSIKKEA